MDILRTVDCECTCTQVPYSQLLCSLSRTGLWLPCGPLSVELVYVGDVKPGIVVDMARVCMNAAPDAGVSADPVEKLGEIRCTGKVPGILSKKS